MLPYANGYAKIQTRKEIYKFIINETQVKVGQKYLLI
jgi:hypothetical protein